MPADTVPMCRHACVARHGTCAHMHISRGSQPGYALNIASKGIGSHRTGRSGGTHGLQGGEALAQGAASAAKVCRGGKPWHREQRGQPRCVGGGSPGTGSSGNAEQRGQPWLARGKPWRREQRQR
eukprot:151317-Chlamydomonas_euryale.AAC.18